MTTTATATLFAAAPLLALAAAGPAADGLDEAGAKARIEAAGYADVSQLHQGNIGDWMAQASRDGRHVMVVVHADGSVALRQQLDTPPPQPVPGAGPAKP